MSDRELAAERAHLAAARLALARMLDTARTRVATGAQVAGDRYTAETLGRMLRGHVKELAEEPAGPLFFGRLSFETGARYHIGRRHIPDENGIPLVIDWRAPVSRAFYRAGPHDRMEVAARRRYGWSGAELTGFEDELLDHETASRLVAEEIERPRVGPMRDIVATIQPDQDELVRGDLDVSVCVQGAPGTGKTAVGLHRAAYLLYAHRNRLARDGVLVLGPNPAFLSYISAVLPALGEFGVEQRTLPELLDRGVASVVDGPAAEAVKHDVRMATVLSRALYAQLGEPTEPLTVPEDSIRWRVSTAALSRLMGEIWQESPPYGVGRERLRARIVGLLRRQAERRGLAPGEAWAWRMGRSRPVRAVLDQLWPRVRPADLVGRLLRSPAQLAAAAEGILSAEEQVAIRRGRRAGWSAADLVLIDEVAGLIDHPPRYGHIVVDEAQDLSPMECRAIARRSVHGSLTVLGDLAQGTTPWAATSWPAQLAHLGKPETPVVALTAGFRVPGAVAAVANRLLATLDVDVPPIRAVRGAGWLRVQRCADLLAGAAAAVCAALEQEGSVAVIAADVSVDALSAVVPVDPRVTVLPARLAKGLEYDHVIVVEPAAIVSAEARGPHRLYVVLTRAVSRLDIVHREPLPGPLGG
ncbi:AAA family ATPase [Asanoa sp. WMMD1127]|uniref:HelD family protein n=1 Tax=Asanoa sp. WMMD1127 TaxID=3016107 RepID=UPI002416F9DA|nr:AAA family ATPase [Asanoa sp. WMMD1127]MDG4823988.1 AAA family ATPase [Asanoa sp. WMMD1127]